MDENIFFSTFHTILVLDINDYPTKLLKQLRSDFKEEGCVTLKARNVSPTQIRCRLTLNEQLIRECLRTLIEIRPDYNQILPFLGTQHILVGFPPNVDPFPVTNKLLLKNMVIL